MRNLRLAGLLVCLAVPAVAETYDLDAGKGLAALEAELSATTDPTPPETFALGAVRFLRAVEGSLQARYRTNAAVGTEWMPVPILRLPFEPNPDPEPFRPEVIRALFEDLTAGMEPARATLRAADLGPDDGVRVDLTRLWFDVDSDGVRSDDEGLFFIVAASLADPFLMRVDPGQPSESLFVRFDAADVEWFVAYTHFLSAVSEFVLAFDPTETIRRVNESRDAIEDLRGYAPPSVAPLGPDSGAYADAFATIYGALNRVPDRSHLGAAREHLLGMIGANREFWTLVNAESDDEEEWIPNGSQTAALPFALPRETGTVWLSVLDDAEAVLNGDLLFGHWRLGPGAGVNVARLIDEPPAIDIVTWMQGEGLVPYMEKGRVASWQSTRRFMSMFRGNALLFMVLLN